MASDQKRRERIILLVSGVPLLAFLGVMIGFGQTPELPLYVVHDGDAPLQLSACSTEVTLPPKSRTELRLRCLFGGGEIVATSGGAAQRERFEDAAPAGLIVNPGGRSKLYVADYSNAYRTKQLVALDLAALGVRTPAPSLPMPLPLAGNFLTKLPPSQPLLLPADRLPKRVEGPGAVLRLEELPADADLPAELQTRLAQTPPPSAPYGRSWKTHAP